MLRARHPLIRLSAVTACVLAFPSFSHSSTGSVADHSGPISTTPNQPRSPRDWVVLASNNEIGVLKHEEPYLRYRTHVINQKGDRIRDVIESKDGTVARTLIEGGKPLSSEADRAERDRLQELADSSSAFARHVKEDAEGKKLATDLIRLMPDAMIYTPAPGMSDARSANGSRQIVLDFEPNPKWSPPSTTSEALTGLRGRVWIDAATGFVTRLDGQIFRSVNIGWGMLAHVYPGGKLSFEQVPVGENRWIYSHFKDEARVRALLLKTIDVSADVSTSDYRPLPRPLTYQEAIAMLLR